MRRSTGEWRLKQMYEVAYFPIAGTMWLLGALGYLPRVKRRRKGEGHERRYFYGSVWAVAIAQPILWLMWKVLPQTRVGDAIKLHCLRRASSRSSATCRGSGCCRAPGRSSRANSPFRTDRPMASIDALTSATLKHLREAWWDDAFTAFLEETLAPRPGNRILDVGCGEGLAEVEIGQAAHFAVAALWRGPRPVEGCCGTARNARHNQRVGFAAADACRLPFKDGAFDSIYSVAVLQHMSWSIRPSPSSRA